MVHINDYVGRRVHMVGIGGSSMSGLAVLLHDKGCNVTGSDGAMSHAVERLRAAGIPVTVGHYAETVRGADLLVYSAAILRDNPERKEAARLEIPQMERATLLGQIMEGHAQAVCVCGAHGKTTASSMLAKILLDTGFDPAVHIGGRLDALGGGTRVGSGSVFVAEACEFNRSFLQMKPTLAVVLNIDADHLDCYRDIDDIQATFAQFLSLVPGDGMALGYGGDARVRALLAGTGCETRAFGITDDCNYTAKNLAYDDWGRASFAFAYRGETLCDAKLRVAGDFNVINALSALAAAHALSADMRAAGASLSDFAGVHRRFEHTGDIDGARMYHDYGHNPAEMRGAVSVAVRQKGAGRVIAVMQPHTFSRVKSLFDDYLTCTQAADVTLVTDIFAARELDPGDIHATQLVDGMNARGVRAVYAPGFADVERWLRANWRPGDIVLTMGCGDINLLNEQMQKNGDSPGFASSK